ncbi:uncharacterized protein LOC126265375 [Aethina tumida]|uniref:uncharacterized protein LOC126265375 n=1 Tax=Aethina tumida TaxID=116153 RepID=UPI002148FA62|nr:uncharacterized protein LOC126265375 [Aethina tumida]
MPTGSSIFGPYLRTSKPRNMSSSTPEDFRCLKSEVFNCMIHILSNNPVVQQLFVKWSELSSKQRTYFDMVLYKVLPKNSLFTAIMSAFLCWDMVQDVEGAVGYQSDYQQDYAFSPEEEDMMSECLAIIKCATNVIKMKVPLCVEIENFSKTSLKIHQPNSGGDNNLDVYYQ